MSEESAQDRELEPTPHRIEEFRRDGRVAMSRDVSSAVGLAAAVLAFGLLGQPLWSSSAGALAWVLEHVGDDGGRGLEMRQVLAVLFSAMGGPALALGLTVAVAAILAGLFQTRFNWAPKALGFKWNRINPVSKLGELFSPQKGGVRVLLAVAKIAAATSALWLVLDDAVVGFQALALGSLASAEVWVRAILWSLMVATMLVLAVVATLDYAWQRHLMGKQIKMTRDEVKRESEEQEGKPEYRRRRRQMHRDLSLNRILRAVPEADVVVTNPTHVAVALRYRAGQDHAPLVTAKGAEHLARQIRRIARRHGVPIIENRPLARALWRKVKVGRAVPATLFQAVAEILARVFRRRAELRGEAVPPRPR